MFECLPAEFPPESPFGKIIKGLVFIDMERGRLRLQQGEQKRGEGAFYHLGISMLCPFLKKEMAGCDLVLCYRGKGVFISPM